MIDTMLSTLKGKAAQRGVNLLLLLSLATLLLGSAAVPLEPELLQQGNPSLTVEGRLVPAQYVALSTAASGQVAALFVGEGEPVQAGTVLLRLGDQEQLAANLAAAEYELLSAQLALERLDDTTAIELALARKDLAEAEKTLAFAESRVKSLKRGPSQQRLEQVYANMLLSERALQRLRDDYALWQQRFKNGNHPIWRFITKRQFKLLLTAKEKEIAKAERRYIDSVQKHEDLQEGVDPVDLAMAESDLALAQASVTDAQKQIDTLRNGPDPDLVAAAQARITVAEAALLAAQTALTDSELLAPISGKVVDVDVKEGEWAEGGQVVIVIADDTDWLVETDDLTEIEVPQVSLGQPVVVTPDALPDVALAGGVEAIKDLSEEKRGDVTYTVTIRLQESDPRLRWGMSVTVDFEP
ncbi:MAG: HlyD family efflux transporter periplasmic adaptor subunit [Anaerolineales bacterium]